MATPHSGSYATQDPNKPEVVIDTEAALAYGRLRRGERPNDIAASMGISRATFYRRISELILRHDRPTRSLMQAIAAEELDELTGVTMNLLDKVVDAEDLDVVSAARLISEARQLNLAKRKLFAVDESEPEFVPLESGEDVEDDDWESDAS